MLKDAISSIRLFAQMKGIDFAGGVCDIPSWWLERPGDGRSMVIYSTIRTQDYWGKKQLTFRAVRLTLTARGGEWQFIVDGPRDANILAAHRGVVARLQGFVEKLQGADVGWTFGTASASDAGWSATLAAPDGRSWSMRMKNIDPLVAVRPDAAPTYGAIVGDAVAPRTFESVAEPGNIALKVSCVGPFSREYPIYQCSGLSEHNLFMRLCEAEKSARDAGFCIVSAYQYWDARKVVATEPPVAGGNDCHLELWFNGKEVEPTEVFRTTVAIWQAFHGAPITGTV